MLKQYESILGKPTATMKAVVTTGHGGYDKLEYCVVPIPRCEPSEVLLQVLSAGINNTDINTRIGWYASSITTDTASTAMAQEQQKNTKGDGGWNKATPFPIIQGTDCCGRVVAVGPGGDETILGKRVLVRPYMRTASNEAIEHLWMGCDFDGAFAQYVKVPASEVFTVDCNWSDAELGSLPCAYGTAENMIQRAKVGEGQHVLVTGASGGVGSAVVQLVKRRNATVTAITSKTKKEQVLAIGADHIIENSQDVTALLGENVVDVVIDNVAGPAFGGLLRVLKRGGSYVSSGAIGGPLVALDMRTVYLKDLTLIGCTAWDQTVFADLISYIERGELRPLVATTFSLEQMVDAQQTFLEKNYVGKLVLIPPPLDET